MDVPRKRQGLHVREIDGETVILDVEGERMHNLNVTAAFILGEIDGVKSEEQIWEAVAKTFGIPVETAEKDTKALLGQLKSLGILG